MNTNQEINNINKQKQQFVFNMIKDIKSTDYDKFVKKYEHEFGIEYSIALSDVLRSFNYKLVAPLITNKYVKVVIHKHSK